MANVTNPTEMVAADQLFKAALQQSNTAISDKQTEIDNLVCLIAAYGHSKLNIDCDKCQYKNNCVSKDRLATLKQELNDLTDEKTQIMSKYSELQDTIKNFLLS